MHHTHRRHTHNTARALAVVKDNDDNDTLFVPGPRLDGPGGDAANSTSRVSISLTATATLAAASASAIPTSPFNGLARCAQGCVDDAYGSVCETLVGSHCSPRHSLTDAPVSADLLLSTQR